MFSMIHMLCCAASRSKIDPCLPTLSMLKKDHLTTLHTTSRQTDAAATANVTAGHNRRLPAPPPAATPEHRCPCPLQQQQQQQPFNAREHDAARRRWRRRRWRRRRRKGTAECAHDHQHHRR
jgi:hypothetical protein